MSLSVRDIETPRLRLRVRDTGGHGRPVVFVHGNITTGEFFDQTLQALPEGFRGLALDLRGFGETEAKPIDATRGLRDFSDDLHALLTSLPEVLEGGQKVVLLGWSVGGGVVLQYAIDHPENVAGLVLEAPMSPYGFGGTKGSEGAACFADFSGSGAGTANPGFVEQVKAGDRSEGSDTAPRKVMNSFFYKAPFRMPSEVEERYLTALLLTRISADHYPGDAATSQNWPGVSPGTRGMNNSLSPKYVNLSAFSGVKPRPKVLWIRGADDQIVSDTSLFCFGFLGQLGVIPGWPGADVYPPQPMVSQMRAVLDAYRAQGGEVQEVVLPDCGHSPHLEKPAEFNQLLTDFLRSIK
jgi:pimeloyl-ACP methyl ester carboxylesterase